MKTVKDDAKKSRRERPLMGVARDRMEVNYADPEYLEKWYCVWVNDEKGEIQKHLRADYQFVTKEEVLVGEHDVSQGHGGIDNAVCVVVDRAGTKAFLMKLERSLYEEDQAKRDALNRAPMDKVRQGTVKEFEGQYKGRNYSVKEGRGRLPG